MKWLVAVPSHVAPAGGVPVDPATLPVPGHLYSEGWPRRVYSGQLWEVDVPEGEPLNLPPGVEVLAISASGKLYQVPPGGINSSFWASDDDDRFDVRDFDDEMCDGCPVSWGILEETR